MPQDWREWLYAARLALWWPAFVMAHPAGFIAGLVGAWLMASAEGSGLDGFFGRAVTWFLLCVAARFLAPRLRPPPFRPTLRAEPPVAVVQPARLEPASDSPGEAAVLERLPAPLQRFLAEERTPR